MTILVQLALTFLGVAFFSIGGASALIPEFFRQIVGVRGWMTASDFAHMVALAQVAPSRLVCAHSAISTASPWPKAWAAAGMHKHVVSVWGPTVCQSSWRGI